MLDSLLVRFHEKHFGLYFGCQGSLLGPYIYDRRSLQSLEEILVEVGEFAMDKSIREEADTWGHLPGEPEEEEENALLCSLASPSSDPSPQPDVPAM